MGRKFLWTIGLILDGAHDMLVDGVLARFPGYGTTEALPHIGNDRLIDRGPTEPDVGYASRLSRAFDTWRNAGGPYALLDNLRAYFEPTPIPVRVVSDRNVWHEIDPVTAEVTRTKASLFNWIWDPYSLLPAPRWWRGWVIIDASDGRWTQWLVGDPDIFVGDGHTVGSTATIGEVASVRRIVRRFKPAHMHCVNVIIAFTPTIFLPTDPPGAPMPDGDYDQLSSRSTDAIYWQGVK